MSRLRSANPVPSGGRRRTPDQVESLLFEVMERTDMVQDISKRTDDREKAPRTGRRQLRPWLGFAAGFALAALIAIPVLLLGGESTDPLVGDPALEQLPAVQADLVSQVVNAINGEDFDAFRSWFAADGAVGFETGLLRPYHQGVEGGQRIPMTDPEGFEADFLWGAALDRRIALRSCMSESARILSCDIEFTLEALRLGGVETMAMALNEAGEIALLATEPTFDAATGEQPLTVQDLSGFETWLEEAHPEDFRRLVRPGTPGSINGVELQSSFAPMNPELVPAMTALIDEYLAAR
jgi:hypothetical protein